MVDIDRAASAVRDLLIALGEDLEREGLSQTPLRVARMWSEQLSGMHEDPGDHLRTTFDIEHGEGVSVRGLNFASMCEHHLLPFIGTADIYYLPRRGGLYPGLSKLARLVDGFARRLQVQERMTSLIADRIMSELDAEGVAVCVRAEHLCMSIRGVQKPGAVTTTTATRGTATTNPDARHLALRMIGL